MFLHSEKQLGVKGMNHFSTCATDPQDAVVVDVRNAYETGVVSLESTLTFSRLFVCVV